MWVCTQNMLKILAQNLLKLSECLHCSTGSSWADLVLGFGWSPVEHQSSEDHVHPKTNQSKQGEETKRLHREIYRHTIKKCMSHSLVRSSMHSFGNHIKESNYYQLKTMNTAKQTYLLDEAGYSQCSSWNS